MVTEDRNRSSADFFKLPREMRDEVYSNLTQDVVLAGDAAKGQQDRLQVTVKNAPIPKLARVSKQFKEEYEKQILPRRILHFKDRGGTLSGWGPVLQEAPSCTFKKMTADLLTICATESCTPNDCEVTMDLSRHAEWINGVQDLLSHAAELNIRLYVHWKDECELQWERMSYESNFSNKLDNITELAGLRKVEVYPFYWQKEYSDLAMCYKIYESHEGMVALWTKGEGWKKI